MAEHELEKTLTMRLLTPAGFSSEVICDSVRLTLKDNADGRGGGSVGILYGHAPAVMALGRGPAVAKKGGEIVLSAVLESGFASVRDNVVTVISDSAVVEGAENVEEE